MWSGLFLTEHLENFSTNNLYYENLIYHAYLESITKVRNFLYIIWPNFGKT